MTETIQVEAPGTYARQCPSDYGYVFRYWDGRLVPVTNMFDVFGGDTHDPRKAHTIVVFLGPNQWQSIGDCTPEEFVKRDDGAY